MRVLMKVPTEEMRLCAVSRVVARRCFVHLTICPMLMLLLLVAAGFQPASFPWL
jgi:hypothetical protein